MNATREFPELEASRLEVAADIFQYVGVGEQLRDMSKPPLSTFAQLPLQPPALSIGCVDDAPP
jgi:hypothetical protein